MAERVDPISNEVLEELNRLGPTIRRIVADLLATRTERDSLRQQLTEALKDSKRLDKLERSGLPNYWMLGPDTDEQIILTMGSSRMVGSPTLREEIDRVLLDEKGFK